MKRVLSILFVLVVLNATAQTKVGDVTMPNTFKFKESNLVLNGAGIREKYWLDLYVGGLYLKAKTADAAKVIASDEAMAIKLHIVSSLITSEKMIESVDEGFKKSTNGNTQALQKSIEQFKSVFKDKIKEGDIYDLCYSPESGVVVIKNGKEATSIKGLEFKKALFGIWFCNSPADADLKTKMLGK